jgi:hypothetical protein
MSDLGDEIERYVQEHFPEGVFVRAGGSEDDAIRSVQEQFDDAGLECSEETARGLVQEAWRKGG